MILAIRVTAALLFLVVTVLAMFTGDSWWTSFRQVVACLAVIVLLSLVNSLTE